VDGNLMMANKTPRTAGKSHAGTKTQSSLLLNPPMAEDVEYLATHSPGGAKPYSVISSGNAIVYLTVPRVREGLTAKEPGKAQREVLEQILGPYQNRVIELYGSPFRKNKHDC
jgi:hypothetical protein